MKYTLKTLFIAIALLLLTVSSYASEIKEKTLFTQSQYSNTFKYYMNKGEDYIAKGSYESAIECFERALIIKHNDKSAQTRLIFAREALSGRQMPTSQSAIQERERKNQEALAKRARIEEERQQKIAEQKAAAEQKNQEALAKKVRLEKERQDNIARKQAAVEQKKQQALAREQQLKQEKQQRIAQAKAAAEQRKQSAIQERERKNQEALAKRERLKQEKEQKEQAVRERQLQRERDKIAKKDAKYTSEFIEVKRKSPESMLAEAQAYITTENYTEALASYNYAYDLTREPSLRKNILIEKRKVRRIIAQKEKEQRLYEQKAAAEEKRQQALAEKERIKQERQQEIAQKKAAAEQKKQEALMKKKLKK